jgi:DNA-binding MarR family transcriptional regulator
MATMTNTTCGPVEARLGGLAAGGWVAVPTDLLRVRKHLGMTTNQLHVVIGLLAYHRTPGVWPSTSQSVLAQDTGFTRETVNKTLKQLRERGLIATKPNPNIATAGSRTKLYCLAPLFAAALWALARAKKVPKLSAEATQLFGHFLQEVRLGRWDWQVDGRSSQSQAVESLQTTFILKFARR